MNGATSASGIRTRIVRHEASASGGDGPRARRDHAETGRPRRVK